MKKSLQHLLRNETHLKEKGKTQEESTGTQNRKKIILRRIIGETYGGSTGRRPGLNRREFAESTAI